MHAWLEKHRAESPRAWLGRALHCPAPDAVGARWLLREYHGARDPQKHWAHNLLRLVVPTDRGRPPVAGLRGTHDNDFLQRWQDLVLDASDFARLRIARLYFEAGRWTLRPEDETHVPVTMDKTIHLSHTAPLRERHASTYVGFTLPGLVANEAEPMGSRLLSMQAGVERSSRGLKLRINWITRGLQAHGYSTYTGTSGNTAGVGYAMSPDLRIGGWANVDPFRHEFSLVLLEPEAAEDASWSLEEWRARLAADWNKLAKGVEAGKTTGRPNIGIGGAYRFLLDHQHTLMNMGAVAGRLPLPTAVAAMRTVQPELRHLSSQKLMVVFARLMAGDEATLSEDQSVAVLARMPDDSYAVDTLGRSGEAWIRLLRSTTSDRIRAFALERLKELQTIAPRAMGDLLEAKRGGEVTLPAWLEQRLAVEPAEDRSWVGLAKTAWPWFTGAALLLVGMVLALAFALRPRRAPGQGLVPAAWLIFVGVLVASVHVSAFGFDHLPDPLGYGLAALGAALLAREVSNARRFLPAILFAVAGVLDMVRLRVELPGLLVTLEAICALLGVVLLPVLGKQLRGQKLDAPSPSSARLPIPFWIFYVLPNGFLIAATLWVQLTGAAEMHIEGGWWLTFAFLAAGVCVLWAVLYIVQAARIRATYLRLRAARPVAAARVNGA